MMFGHGPTNFLHKRSNMATYPVIMTTAIPKRIRTGTVSQSIPIPTTRYSKGPNMFKRMIKILAQRLEKLLLWNH